ncbi:MAG: hypothetical protein QW734_10235 [Candidatus Bathyarchaeia archaeon]
MITIPRKRFLDFMMDEIFLKDKAKTIFDRKIEKKRCRKNERYIPFIELKKIQNNIIGETLSKEIETYEKPVRRKIQRELYSSGIISGVGTVSVQIHWIQTQKTYRKINTVNSKYGVTRYGTNFYISKKWYPDIDIVSMEVQKQW